MVWERTPNLTATMLGLGMLVSVLAMFKGGCINTT
jgi:hypothetical protein